MLHSAVGANNTAGRWYSNQGDFRPAVVPCNVSASFPTTTTTSTTSFQLQAISKIPQNPVPFLVHKSACVPTVQQNIHAISGQSYNKRPPQMPNLGTKSHPPTHTHTHTHTKWSKRDSLE
ncbi:hypothetical protein ACJQWK_06984 [Exserohilum turcicum]